MKVNAVIFISLSEFMHGAAFSLCTLVTLGELFYRRIKSPLWFPVIAGAVFSAAALVQQTLFGGVMYSWVYLLHTAAVFFLLTGRSRVHILPLIFAEIFSAGLIGSIRTAVFSLTPGTENSPAVIILLYAAGYVISAAFVLLLKRLVRSEDREPLGMLQMLLLTAMTYFVSVMIGRSFEMSEYVPDVSPDAAIPSVLLIMSVTVLLLFSVKQQQAKRFRELNVLSEKYMSAQAKHFIQAREADTEMRMLRHDMKNHITAMNGLYAAGRTEELGEYLRELGSSFADTQAAVITGNEIADAIISEKTALAESCGVKLSAEGSLKGLDISSVMLCTVLSNLLDNAIEAASTAGKGSLVDLSVKRSGSFYYISVINPTANAVDVTGEIATSKPDSEHHGLGLRSVRSAVEKCGGTLELGCKEKAGGFEFTAEVILPSGSRISDVN